MGIIRAIRVDQQHAEIFFDGRAKQGILEDARLHLIKAGNKVTAITLHPAAIHGIVVCFAMMASLDVWTWVRLVVWLAIGLTIYFSYSRYHSHLVTMPEPAPPKVSAKL